MTTGRARHVRRCGATLAASGLALGLVSIAMAASPFNAGIWSDTEPMIAAVFAVGAITSIGIGMAALSSRAAGAALIHPVVLTSAALTLWSFLAATVADHPIGAMFGSPQLGEGCAFWAAFTAFCAGASLLRPTRLFRWLAGLLCVTAILVASINTVARVEPDALQGLANRLRLMKYDEFQAYFALACFGVATALHVRRQWPPHDRDAVASGRPHPALVAALAVGIVVSLLASHNRTAMAAVALAVGLMTPCGQNALAWCTARACTIAALVALALIGPLIIGRLVDFRDFAPTFWARSELAQVLDATFLRAPGTILWGHGWGHYQELLTANVDLASVRPPAGESSWEALLRDMFHSHNAVLEALVAAGVPGALLRLALPIVVALHARRRSVAIPFVLAWSLTDALWFTLPSLLAPLALAVAAQTRRGASPRPGLRRTAAVLAIGAGIGLALCAFVQTRDILQSSAVIACLPPNAPRSECPATADIADLRGDGVAIATVLKGTIGPAIGAGATLDRGQRGRMRDLLAHAEARQEAAPTAVLGLALADAYAQIAWSDHGEELLAVPLAQTWPASLSATLRAAPARIDAYAPYLNWLVAHGRDPEIDLALQQIAPLNPRHPVFLWFSGWQGLGSTDRLRQRQGLVDMREALMSGLERIMPVDATVRRRVLQGR